MYAESMSVMAMLLCGTGRYGCGECMGGTHNSGVSSSDDMLEMSVVRGVRDVVCEMYMCFTRDVRCGE